MAFCSLRSPILANNFLPLNGALCFKLGLVSMKTVLTLCLISILFSCESTENKNSQNIDVIINKLEVAAKNGKECSNFYDSKSVACKAFITYIKNNFKQDSAVFSKQITDDPDIDFDKIMLGSNAVSVIGESSLFNSRCLL